MGAPANSMTVRWSSRPAGSALAAFLIASFASLCSSRAAEPFDDVVVSPQSSHDGDTYHGYREFRVLLENRSARETRRVTLVLPDHFFGWGNSLRSIQRTAVLAPGAMAEMSLWQPPSPMFGSGGMGVIVDGEERGSVSMPNAQRHMMPGGMRGYSKVPATFLVSRSLDPDEVTRAFVGETFSTPLSAGKATGEPDAGTRRGVDPNAWMPDPSSSGPSWIELTYPTSITGGFLRVLDTTGMLDTSGAAVALRSAAGTNLALVPMTSPGHISTGPRPMPITVSLPPTAEPAISIRLEFAAGSRPCIDAVALVGTGGATWWATGARASSDASRVASSFTGATPLDSRQFVHAELPVAEWSSSWLSYTPWDAVILSRADQATLPGPVLAALQSYVEAGGNLFLLGGSEIPRGWRGSGRSPIPGGYRTDLGFGWCFVLGGEKPSDISPAAAETMQDAADISAGFWQSLPWDEAANSLFPVVDNLTIPVRSIVLVMLGFILMIGPVNLVVLTRLKRRTWMLWTIPAISLATCGLVFVYSFLREGFTPDCRFESVTFLDQADRRATSFGADAIYCPLTPSDGLRFSSDTEATPLVRPSQGSSGAQREIDWTQSQHFRRGWVTARVPAHFLLRKSEGRRERLQLISQGADLEVVNGLGAPVISLFLCDSAGRLFQGSQIAAGQQAPLIPTTRERRSEERLGVRPLFFEASYGAQCDLLTTNAAAYLRSGTYVAELDGSPFLENGLGNRNTRLRNRAFVYGVLDPPATP